MVKLDKIYTRGGDKGETSLCNGQRVPKNHVCVEAFGVVDEASAAIGLARLHTDKIISQVLADIQQDLFDLGADLSTPLEKSPKKTPLRIVSAQVTRLEEGIDAFNKELAPLQSFILPGGTPAAAYLHLARTIVRRAERQLVPVMEVESVNPQAFIYLNRLSDFLFVLGRYCNNKGRDDILWIPGKNR